MIRVLARRSPRPPLPAAPLSAAPARQGLPAAWVDTLILVVLIGGLAAAWNLLARPVTVSVDGFVETVRTRRATVGDLLGDLGVLPGPQDRINVLPAMRLADLLEDQPIVLERARPLRVVADGEEISASTFGASVGEALADAGVQFASYDRALVNGADSKLDALLPPLERTVAPATFRRAYGWNALSHEPVQIRLRRALPIVVDEGAAPYTVQTTAQTVGEALREAGVTLYLGDRVEPSLGSSVVSGLRVEIARSTPVSVQVGGERLKTRTQAETVADALSSLNIIAAGLDRIEPPPETPLFPNIEIRITRISEEVVVEEQIEPFETIFQGDPNLPIDTQQVTHPGAEGIQRQRYRVVYENGQEVSRVLEDSWIAQAPATRIIGYGQMITPQTAVVDGVEITYWRKVKMLATSYSPAAVGGNTRTYTGDTMRPGIVAIDPKIVPLRSRVFVPGYGFGDALDIGGGIISRRIDLGYDDATYVSVLRWTDVYLLWPPPPANKITWVVPNYPKPPN